MIENIVFQGGGSRRFRYCWLGRRKRVSQGPFPKIFSGKDILPSPGRQPIHEGVLRVLPDKRLKACSNRSEPPSEVRLKPRQRDTRETLTNSDFGKPDLGYHCVTDMQNKPMSLQRESRNPSGVGIPRLRAE
ncbi:MAG: hypothetical protein LBF91_01135 [Azoarcus sp.]|jgi:hypothetical protein|nr:hypothetical protein [Azoarcus sp.]